MKELASVPLQVAERAAHRQGPRRGAPHKQRHGQTSTSTSMVGTHCVQARSHSVCLPLFKGSHARMRVACQGSTAQHYCVASNSATSRNPLAHTHRPAIRATFSAGALHMRRCPSLRRKRTSACSKGEVGKDLLEAPPQSTRHDPCTPGTPCGSTLVFAITSASDHSSTSLGSPGAAAGVRKLGVLILKLPLTRRPPWPRRLSIN
jgi:hypothetical protein